MLYGTAKKLRKGDKVCLGSFFFHKDCGSVVSTEIYKNTVYVKVVVGRSVVECRHSEVHRQSRRY